MSYRQVLALHCQFDISSSLNASRSLKKLFVIIASIQCRKINLQYFSHPNKFNASGTHGKLATETFNGTIALNDPKESALRDVMMTYLRKRTNDFQCSFSWMTQTDIADLSMLCFLYTSYIEQHLIEQSIQELLEYSDEDLGRALHENKSFFPQLCSEKSQKRIVLTK
jgi:hypothetical protein